ncbi:MAG: arsenite/tail-anchored protein-transporting ATPase [Actinomycetota bacterium]|nr:arsenite/tail-anchored protein-transporting ATPase [Actinomycetota bacterium]
MRLLLLTGKGGAGTTTVAAATALHAATCGTRTLLISLDRPDGLGRILGTRIGPRTVTLSNGLHVRQAGPGYGPATFPPPDDFASPDDSASPDDDPTPRDERLERVLADADLDPLPAADLAGLPGAQDILTLLDLFPHLERDDLDLVVLDCPPPATTLRLLALPETLRDCLDQLLPVERRVLRAMARGKHPRGDGPPRDHLADETDSLRERLLRVRDLLTGPGASVRLVLTPQSAAIESARRAWTALSLLGHAVDALVVNQVINPESGPWPAELLAAQKDLLCGLAADFEPLPVLRAYHALAEPVGTSALAAPGEDLYGPCGKGSAGELLTEPAVGRFRVERRGEEYLMVLPLPLVDRERVRLSRRGDDLVMEVPGQRRVMSLPSALRRCRVTVASLRDAELTVRFRPDPALWPTA